MNLQQLYYFKVLAKKEHLHKAADELFISPSALSATITRLENELGVELFKKHGRNIELTPKGKFFYSRIAQILADLDSTCKQIQSFNDSSLNIWTVTSISWLSAFAEFVYTHPDISFRQFYIDAKDIPFIPADIHPDMIICPLTTLPPDKYDYEVLIKNDYTVLVVYEGHPFWDRTEVSLEEIITEPFVMPSSNDFLKEEIIKIYRQYGCKPHTVAEADAQLRSHLVREKRGITMSSKWAMNSSFYSGLKGIPISKPEMLRTQVIAWLKGKPLNDTQIMFVDFIKTYIKNVDSNC